MYLQTFSLSLGKAMWPDNESDLEDSGKNRIAASLKTLLLPNGRSAPSS
jgi:hypothetical protein